MQYFLYKFPEDVDSVIIKVMSEKAYPCSVVSVQNIMVSLNNLSTFGLHYVVPGWKREEGEHHVIILQDKTAQFKKQTNSILYI